MKRLLLVLVFVAAILNPAVKADEGMWIPLYIEKMILEDMQRLGLELTAEQLFSLEQPAINDAIVIFGRGCTGEIVSDKGLLLTNHHCGYGAIQSISTVENDYLTHGYWAATHQDELYVPGLTVSFMVDMKRVTDEMLEGVTAEMTERERNEQINANRRTLITEAEKDTHFRADVRTFFEGNEFYLVAYETFNDIRLVGTPPESIGKFGADTDNWMWPRHTGDFAFFRVYADADNKPAEYSADNKPYKPRHFLPISINGIKKDDFTMILGNPGSTDRYLSSWGIHMAIEQTNPTIVSIRDEKLRVYREGMDASEKVRLQYASKWNGVSNYWKYLQGQTRGLKRLNVAGKKEAQQAAFTKWLENDADAMQAYGQALPLIESAYETMAEYNLARIYYTEAITRGSELLFFANRFNRLGNLLAEKNKDTDAIEKETERLRQGIEGHFKNYDRGIDQNLLAAMLRMYFENVPVDQQALAFRQLVSRHGNDFDRLAAHVFNRSQFVSPTQVNSLLDKPRAKTVQNDPALQLARIFIDWHNELNGKTAEAFENLRKGNRLYMAGLKAMQPDRHFYPNANFTMRITYGTVQDYYPADAVHYDYVTTVKGILEKEDPTVWEFEVPDRLKEIITNKEFGPYGNKDGTMAVCFLTDHDITGGNSGSPVIDGKGRLVGLAFDGNWEAMSGDIAFEPELQRTINVDIRYVLLIVDKFAGAKNLIDEMVIVKDRPKLVAPADVERQAVREEAIH